MNSKQLIVLILLSAFAVTGWADDADEASENEGSAVVEAAPAPAAAGAACTESYRVVYEVPNLDRIPRYDQSSSLEKADSSICFAAAASQAIDVFRYGLLSSRGQASSFEPSSPLLMASLYFHTDHVSSGVAGGSETRVIQNALRMGTCRSLVTRAEMQSGLITVNQEIESLQRLVQAPNRVLYRDVFDQNHADFFNRTMAYCQPNAGTNLGADQVYAARTFTQAEWNQALESAQNSRYGIQAVALGMCGQALSGRPFDVNSRSDEMCSGHAVALMGKRCRCGTDCQVLIRDSYQLNGTRGENQEQIRPNDIWMPEATIRSGSTDLTVITDVSEVPVNTLKSKQALYKKPASRAPASLIKPQRKHSK